MFKQFANIKKYELEKLKEKEKIGPQCVHVSSAG